MLVNLARLKGGSVEDLRIFALFIFECGRRMLKSLNDDNDKRPARAGEEEGPVPFLAQVSIVVDLYELGRQNMVGRPLGCVVHGLSLCLGLHGC